MRRFQIIEAEQRSDAWRQARAGRLTGSRAHIIFAKGKTKGSESIQRRDYRLQLVSERISGEAQANLFTSADMQHGIDIEPMAFARYESSMGDLVRRTGFIQHLDYMAGCSLDGDINDFTGIIELKCPKLGTHLLYMTAPDLLRNEYIAQVRHNLWITGAAFCDLMSFNDALPARFQMLRVRVERYEAELPEYETEALKFLKEVEDHYQMIMDGAYG